ncbi:MAG: TonB-dependent receptor [Pseudomonadota bacterium]
MRGGKRSRDNRIGALSAILLAGGAALVESALARDVTATFEADYFDQFTPRNAREMVDRVPGFEREEAEERRGLGQGGANVLINGARTTGKTTIEDQLNRINATNVERIEILDGATLGVPGLTGQVANVVTRAGGLSGTWQWFPYYESQSGLTLAEGGATLSGEWRNLSFSSEVYFGVGREGTRSDEILFVPDGAVFEERFETSEAIERGPFVSLDIGWTPRADHKGNLTFEYYQSDVDAFTPSDRFALAPPGESNFTRFDDIGDDRGVTVGADYELPLLFGTLKAIGYVTREDSDLDARLTRVVGGDTTEFVRNDDLSESGETIARLEFSFARSETSDWQLALERAFNFLETDSRLFELNDMGDVVETPFDGGSSRVEEVRYEATLANQRSLTSDWNIQVSLGAEYSEISQADLVRDFFRPKGFVSTTYQLDRGLSLRAQVSREVGQLDFSDFVSSVSLEDDLNSVGNPNLVPEQSWRAEIELEKRFDDGSRLSAQIYGELISDLVDRIPIGADGDAVGNIDSAERYGFEISGTLKGESIGLGGVEIDLLGVYEDSAVDDPLLGTPRRLNRSKIYEFTVNYRHDIPNTQFAYGVDFDMRDLSKTFRLDSITDIDRDPELDVYVEAKDVRGVKIVAEVDNVAGSSMIDVIERFSARRDVGVLESVEFAQFKPVRTLWLTIGGTF